MTYQLLIDCGNTFLKWGRYQPRRTSGNSALDNCIEFNRVLLDEISALPGVWRRHEPPSQIVISSVAGTKVRNPILRALEAWPNSVAPHFLSSQAEQCGVRNGYLNPGQLGSDRWASLIGARGLFPGQPVLIAVCGTATTVDLLSAGGEFLGGSILPGLGLMQRVLHEQTAALPDAQGEYVDHPRQTVDAITSGCTHAQVGAIERQFALYRREHPQLRCLVSGGAASNIISRLTIPFVHHENLVLEGLYQIAQDLQGIEDAGAASPNQ